MLRTIKRLSPTIAISIFQRPNQHDYNILEQEVTSVETGWDRIKMMYSKNEYDEPSKELNTVAQATSCGFFFGAAFGGFIKGRHAYINFIENNQ